jgi:hypothetical protein
VTADERADRDERERYDHIREQLADWQPPTDAQIERLRVLLPPQRLAS